ncbi:hypothetical protein KAR91_11925 [Candidatus Pacearchaeota archaeon]|nr:hypothetical protein [Candidatus Pacearchaeota archaeon]
MASFDELINSGTDLPEAGVDTPPEGSQAPETDFDALASQGADLDTSVDPQGAELRSYEPDLFERIGDMFRDPAAEGAKATQALVDAEIYGISPSQALKLGPAIDRKRQASVSAKNTDTFFRNALDEQDIGVGPINPETAISTIKNQRKKLDGLLKNSPGYADYALNHNLENATQDADGLTGIESAFKEGVIDPAMAIARFVPRSTVLLGKFANDATAMAAGILDSAAMSVETMTGLERGGGFTWLRDWSHNAARQQGKMLQEGEFVGTPEDIRGKRLWGNPQLLLDPEWVITNLGDAATSLIPVIAMTYATGGSYVAGGLVGGALEGGSFYNELREEGLIEEPVDDITALNAALTYGAASAWLNKIGLQSILGKGVAARVRKSFAKHLMAGGTEAVTEWLEEPTQGLIETFAREGIPTEGKDFDKLLENIAEAAKNIDMIPGSIMLGGGISYLASRTPSQKVIEARGDQAFFAALDESAAQSITRQNDPDEFARAFETIKNGSGASVESVFTPARALRDAIPADELAGTLETLGVTAEYEAAFADNDDVIIPISKYAAYIAGTDVSTKLRPDLKYRVDGLTGNQADELDPPAEKIAPTAKRPTSIFEAIRAVTDPVQLQQAETDIAVAPEEVEQLAEQSSIADEDLDAIIGDEAQEDALIERLFQEQGIEIDRAIDQPIDEDIDVLEADEAFIPASIGDIKVDRDMPDAVNRDFQPTGNIETERVGELGTTTDIREAGYLNTEGEFIDLSGKNEGGTPGVRSYDHREVGGNEGMFEFINLGNIRLGPEAGLVDIMREPNEAQTEQLSAWIDHFNGEVVVELQDGLGEHDDLIGYKRSPRHTTINFNSGTSSTEVINTINRFYEGESFLRGTTTKAQIGPGDVSPIFFSAVEQGVTDFKQETAPAQQWQAMINKLPIKKEEMEWIGLDDFLKEQKGKVSKQEILDFIQANAVQIEEVVKEGKVKQLEWKDAKKGAKYTVSTERNYRIEHLPNGMFNVLAPGGIRDLRKTLAEAKELAEEYNQNSGTPETKFAEYQLPGGENYKELLLTLPDLSEDESLVFTVWAAREKGITIEEISKQLVEKGTVYQEWEKKIRPKAIARKEVFRSAHYEEPNILAHIRFNERTDADGNRVLFIEEIQSDWHQKGRKEGYALPLKEGVGRDALKDRLREIEKLKVGLQDAERYRELDLEVTAINRKLSGRIPDAPFKKTWPLLAIKRMVRYAAENGFDKVAWTTGEQQAERYDLSKQVDKINILKETTGNYLIQAVPAGTDAAQRVAENVPVEKLSDYIGKEPANKAQKMLKETPDVAELAGLDLKVGGEGMKAFYDKMLPSMVNKFFKKFGGKVGRTNISENKFPDYVHSLTITPKMKETVLYQGQPLFAVGQAGRRNTKPNQTLPEFSPERIQHVGLKEATQAGIIATDEAAVIDGVMQTFPESWRQHFEPRFSEQVFAPTEAQLKAHGVPAAQRGDKIIQGVLLEEQVGELKTDARHLAVMFTHSENVSTFLHEFGEFAHKRLLNRSDASTVKAEWKKARTKGKTKQDRNEWFSDSFRDWWLRQLNGESDIVSPELHGIFRKLMSTIKEIWRRLKSMRKKTPLDALFEDIITNGREINEKYYYSAQEAAKNYVIGAEASREQIAKQGFSGNSKTMVSWDPGSICPKQRNLVDYALEQAFGKSLDQIRDEDATSDVWQTLSDIDFWVQAYDQAVKDGIDAPCSYCYVEQARKKALGYWKKGKPITGVNFAMDRLVYETTNYRDGILKWKQEKIDDLNDRGGLRMFSFSDYVRDLHKNSVTLLLKHAKQRGLSVTAITKNPEFVEDFADSGIIINVSIDDEFTGMDWDKAAEFKAKHKNVKVRTVAKTFNHYIDLAYRRHMGHEQFIDVITPYHHEDTAKPMPEGFEDLGINTRGGRALIAWIDENDPELRERTCCLAGGKCFGGAGHQTQCGSNCGALAGTLGVPAAIGDRVTKKDIRELTGVAKDYTKTVSERAALHAAFKKAAQNARIAFREGNKEGVAAEKARMKALLEKAKTRKTGRADITKLRGQIARALKFTKVKKQKGKPKGKFGAQRQEILNRLRVASRLTKFEAEAAILANLERYKEDIPPIEVAMENRVLAMVAGTTDPSQFDTHRMFLQDLLAEVKAFKEEGELEVELGRQNLLGQLEFMRQEAIHTVTGGKGLPKGIDTVGEAAVLDKTIAARLKRGTHAFLGSFVGWKDLLDILSSKDVKTGPMQSALSKWADVLDVKNAEKKGNREAMEQLREIVFDAYNIKTDHEMVRMFRKDAEEVNLGTFENLKGEMVDLILTRAQARKRIMEALDPTLHGTLFTIEGMAYTQEMVESIRDFLTPQDENFIGQQLAWYQQYYEGVNEVYSDVYGVNLPKNINYSPIKREGVGKDQAAGLGEFFLEMPFRAAATSGSLISRVSNKHHIREQSDINVMMRHVAEMEHFKNWAYKIRDLNGLFGDQDVKQAIRLNYGKEIMGLIDSYIRDMASNGAQTAQTLNWLDKFRINYTRSVLALKPSIYIKQLTSFIAFADAIPVKDFMEGLVSFSKNPKEAMRTLASSEMMMARGENIERDISAAIKSDPFSAFRTSSSLNNAMMINVKMGDRGAIYFGGWSVYRYYKEIKKMSHEEAIRMFESITESTQQSADLSEQSFFQRGGAFSGSAASSFSKLFTMFLSSPNQYLRKEIGAIRNAMAGRISKKQLTKTIIIYHILLPMFFQWVSDRFTWDEDEQKRAMILGPLNGFFIIGDGLDYIIRSAIGMHTFGMELPFMSAFKDFAKAVKVPFQEDDITVEDFIRALRGLAGAVAASPAPVVGGKPLKQIIDMSVGVSDTLSGEYEKGIAGMAGWSPYAAEKAAADDDE